MKKTFACNDKGMIGAQAFLEAVCAEPKPAIVMDEIVSNIVRCSGSADFTLDLEQTDEGLVMEFVDSGRAFDPTQDVATPDIAADLAERSVGGLGIFMVRKMAKSVAYCRDDGRNVLTVVL